MSTVKSWQNQWRLDKKPRAEVQEQNRPKQAKQTDHERAWGKLRQNVKSRYDDR